MLQVDEASEVAACIRGGSMHQRWQHVSEEHEGRQSRQNLSAADRARGEYKISKVVKTIRTCQNRIGLVWGYFCYM
jgi:hypothetical protein